MHIYIYIYGQTRLHYPARLRARVINGMLVYHTLGFSMNKYMYKVGFVNLKFLNKTIKKVCINMQFNYNFNNRKNDCKQIMKYLISMNTSCLFS